MDIRNRISGITDEQAGKFIRFYEMLISANEYMNLTAITEEKEVIEKHFLDSLLPIDLIEKEARVIDIGTGAGFPGIPIKIIRPDIDLTLIDARNKRVGFLKELLDELNLKAETFHARAEDLVKFPEYSGAFDTVLTRAVAPLETLIKWTAQYLKLGGESIMYKGPGVLSEMKAAEREAKFFGVTLTIKQYEANWGERNMVIAKRTEKIKKNKN
ncbi:MAG: 16S rRNA (guanine(527)-N(7))-methyltransferase RsmG [Clostridia bacterium]